MGGGGDAERFVVVGEVLETERDLAFGIGREVDGGGEVVGSVELDLEIAEDGFGGGGAVRVGAGELEDGHARFAAGAETGDAEGPALL